MTQAITSTDTSRNNLLMVAAGGLVSGILTPLLPTLIDQIVGLPGQLRISLIAVPFAVLVFILVRRFSANPRWAAGLAAIITMVAFVCAVNAAIFIDGQTAGAATDHAISARRIDRRPGRDGRDGAGDRAAAGGAAHVPPRGGRC